MSEIVVDDVVAHDLVVNPYESGPRADEAKDNPVGFTNDPLRLRLENMVRADNDIEAITDVDRHREDVPGCVGDAYTRVIEDKAHLCEAVAGHGTPSA